MLVRTRRHLIAAAVAVTLVVVLPSGQAHADPTVAELEAQIQQLWAEAEPLIEEYNGVHEQYQQNQAKQAELLSQIEPLQRQIELGQIRIGAIAAEAYKGGQASAFNAVLSSGSPGSMRRALMR